MSLLSKGLGDGYIYVISLGFDDLYKIGFSRKLKKRMKALSPANPRLKLVMSYKVLGMKKIEKFIHGKLRFHHFERELFALNSADLSWLKNYLEDEHKKYLRAANGTCPICGNVMVLRENLKKGRKFYGCLSYPSCHFTFTLERMGSLTQRALDEGYESAKSELSASEPLSVLKGEPTPALRK